jgi:hypothetical protein
MQIAKLKNITIKVKILLGGFNSRFELAKLKKNSKSEAKYGSSYL